MSGWMAREERQARILALAYQKGRIRMADLRASMPENHPETLRLDCADLVDAGLLRAIGAGRGRVYVVAVSDLLDAVYASLQQVRDEEGS